MSDTHRSQVLSFRRKEKLKKILLSEFGVKKLEYIDQELKNVDDLFDEGLDFAGVLEEIRRRIERNCTPMFKQFPVRPKEGEDEWAGIIKHQADVQEMAEIQAQLEEAEKKKKYKEELDNYLKSQQQFKSQQELRERNEEKQLKDFSDELSSNISSRDQFLSRNRFQVQKQLQDESLNEYYKTLEEKHVQRAKDREEFLNGIKTEEEKARRRAEIEKREAFYKQQEINLYNAYLLKLKEMEKEKEKIVDKQYINNAFSHWDDYEERRQRFLSEYDEFSHKFYEMQRKMQPVSPMEIKSKEDEIRALEFQKAQADYQRRKEYEEKINQMNSYKENQEAIKRQIKEKQEINKKIINEDQNYAFSLAERQRRLDLFVNQEKQRNRLKQQQYSELISYQIQEKQSDKKRLHKMNEDERKINRRDLEAYQLGSHQIYAKVPGYSLTPTNISQSHTPVRRKSDLSSKLYNPNMNNSFSSGRSTPNRSGYLAYYGNNILQNHQ
ncbi:unnamed protein product [Blepharisma stoltei]|uniref:Uncharacterized protein n=1 Tax=Blepharisma stoltei TaxID=1481888 RepID=A0AAU9KCE4_9CILI|nr:unnamed protein product [Blepharisma stoltei]